MNALLLDLVAIGTPLPSNIGDPRRGAVSAITRPASRQVEGLGHALPAGPWSGRAEGAMRAWVVRGEGNPWEVFRAEEVPEPSHEVMGRYALDLVGLRERRGGEEPCR